MPTKYGMEGDFPPRQRRAPRRAGPIGRSGQPWSRGPGYFSGPLLANPQFRKLFLARTKEILETIYTEQVFVPIINAMGERLQLEVKLQAELMKSDPERAINNLEQNLQNLRDHIKKRR